jgi:non-ribosomal peptide synthase protein (TIGR01720 family)
VKLRGQRIELQEVEHHVQSLLATDNKNDIQIVAEVIEPEGSGNPTLVAFVHSTMNHSHLEAAGKEAYKNAVRKMTDGIEDRLGDNVPVYMIPTAFIPLQSIPVTVSGKTDRRRLRELGASMYSAHRVQKTKNGYRPPSSELENLLQIIWSKVLNIPLESIAIDTAFTRLGGDSISSMQVVSRCRAKNISITTSDILRSKTIEKLALCCKEVKPKSVVAEESTEETLWHLSPIQQMFFEFHPQGLDHFNQSFMLKLKAPVSNDVLSAAIRATVSRHPMLRARFWPDSSGCWQQLVVKDSQHAFAFERHMACQRSEVQAIAKARQESLSILSGPVFAADVFSIPGEEQSLLLTAHHLIIDLMSWRIVWHDIEQHIRGCEGREFAPEPISFQVWSKVQRHTSQSLQLEHVLPSHSTAPDFGFWGVDLGENDSSHCRSYVETLDERTTGLLLGRSNESYRTEPVDILLAALKYSFQQVFTDRRSPPIFLEGHGREPPEDLHIDLSETVGWFTSMHPVDAPITADDSVLTAVKSVKDYRRRVPGKGQPYFAYRYHTEDGRRVFDSHREMEVILNYTGRFQQLESDNGLFQPEDRLDLVSGIEEVSPKAQRFSLIEVSADIVQGKLALSFYINKRMNHQGKLEDWAKLTQHNLNLAVHQLANTEPAFTLSDFSLLSSTNLGLERLLSERLMPIGVRSSDILDIYPCTPVQEGILLSREKGAASYANFWVWNCIPSFDEDSVSPDRLEEAWRLVASQHSILSTIFTEQLDGGGYVQVLLSNPQCRVVRMDSLSAPPADALLKVESPVFSAGQPSHTFTIAWNADGHVACRLDISHLLIDASSLHILLKSLAKSYQRQAIERAPQFRNLVAHLRHQTREEKLAFWTNSLFQARPCRLITAPAYGSLANTDGSSRGMITIPAENAAGIDHFCRSKGITRSVFLQVAWSLVLSRYTGMSDITFGYMASGRDAPIRDIENMVGPLINLLISRIDLNQSLDKTLVKTSENSIEQLRFQHSSLADIQHALSMGSEQLFNTALTVREQFLYESTREIRFDEIYGHDPHEVNA